jgi:hypothetical protein
MRQVRRVAVLAGLGAMFLVSAIAAQGTLPIHVGGRGRVVGAQHAAPVSHAGGGGRGHKVA